MWQSPIVTAGAAAEPVSLAEAKQFLRLDLDDTAFDFEVEIHIAGARERIERTTSTRLITQTVTIAASSFADLVRLPIGPVQQIVDIHYVDPSGNAQTLDDGVYELAGADLEWSIQPTIGTAWPATANRPDAVTVTAIVGYGIAGDEMPNAVRVALLLTTRSLFDDTTVDIDAWLANHRIWL